MGALPFIASYKNLGRSLSPTHGGSPAIANKLLPACPAFSLFARFPVIRGCRHWAAARVPKTD